MQVISILKEIKSSMQFGYERDIETADGYLICLWWHMPSLNLGVYPILQIMDKNGETIFYRKGPENSDYWGRLIDDAITCIERSYT